jgi:hypothetical protein
VPGITLVKFRVEAMASTKDQLLFQSSGSVLRLCNNLFETTQDLIESELPISIRQPAMRRFPHARLLDLASDSDSRGVLARHIRGRGHVDTVTDVDVED